MHSDQRWPSYRSDNPRGQDIHPNFEEEEEEEEEEEDKGGPPLYYCTCRNNPTQCEYWAEHKNPPRFYTSLKATCKECGHTGTMKRASK